MNRFLISVFAASFFSMLVIIPPSIFAQDIDAPADEMVEDDAMLDESAQESRPRFIVLLPEQIDRQWFWFFYTDETQHIVQSEVEKALLRAGFEVIDVSLLDSSGSIHDVTSRDTALQKAKAVGAEYVIMGTAISDKKSSGVAYGVTVVRASASITARIVRVSDGKVMAVEEAEAEEGGQALKGASREALKKAGRDIARKLAKAAEDVAEKQE